MPSNMQTENETRRQNAANPNAWLPRILSTFRGWILRKAVTYGTVLSAAVTAWMTAQLASVTALAERLGVPAEQVRALSEHGASLATVAGAFLGTVALAAVEIALSRVAARTVEVPKAVRVEDPTDIF